MEPEAVAVPGAVKPVPEARRGARTLIVLCSAVLAAALVAGAAGIRSGDADENVLRGFQIRVLSISQAAAENRMDGALAALQALEKDLGDAAANGRLSASRYRSIENALSAVRTDLATQVAAAAPAAPPAAAPDAVAPAPALAGTGQEQAAPVEAAVPAVAPAPAAPAPEESAPEAPGQERSEAAKEAKGKGKGPGKP
ncbi:hypothetical protein QFZ60_002111 [Arthrobacter sp. B2I5]|uniref:hypothetical protein n=1 Tax=Arthrobacter sp. B2I5 TaxID=3042266 RepID=UPI002789531B|nr:hypothetical protein [Arthrobacter sp. B2I5]MDQ0825938.1 hypothetical protein [Arthrobacter sp. B2I5]